MKRMPKIKYLITVIAAFLLLCGMSVAAYADADSPSFTYRYPVDGVKFKLYEVGEIVDDEFVLGGDFAAYNVNLLEKTAAETLAAYVERDEIAPIAEGETSEGAVVFENLQKKVYMMTGETKIVDRVRWIPQAVLFSIPQKDENTGELIWDVTAGGKYDHEPLPELTSVSVEKIWKDKGYESKRPESIKAQLLKDDEIFDTVELNKGNNWSYTWKDLEPEFTWKVVEEKVPDEYKVTIEKRDGKIILVNTHKETTVTPTPPPHSPNIPYTGQLWWPVGILLVIGIGLVLIGLIRRKRSE